MESNTSNHDDKIMHCSTFDELLDAEYGKPGTTEREQFDADAAAFCLAETLKEERLKAGLPNSSSLSVSVRRKPISPVWKTAKLMSNSAPYSESLRVSAEGYL